MYWAEVTRASSAPSPTSPSPGSSSSATPTHELRHSVQDMPVNQMVVTMGSKATMRVGEGSGKRSIQRVCSFLYLEVLLCSVPLLPISRH